MNHRGLVRQITAQILPYKCDGRDSYTLVPLFLHLPFSIMKRRENDSMKQREVSREKLN